MSIASCTSKARLVTKSHVSMPGCSDAKLDPKLHCSYAIPAPKCGKLAYAALPVECYIPS